MAIAYRITPYIRTSLIENSPLYQKVHYFKMKSDCDFTVAKNKEDFQLFTLRNFIKEITKPELKYVAVSEPLWFKYWFQMCSLILLSKVTRKLLKLPRVKYVTYAIENLEWRSRLTIPFFDRISILNVFLSKILRAAICRSSLKFLDAIAYGSRGSYDIYQQLFGENEKYPIQQITAGPIKVCNCLQNEKFLIKKQQILFLGEKSERKGYFDLLNIWEEIGANQSSWDLICVGPIQDSMSKRELNRLQDIEVPSRVDIHQLLKESSILVLPSKKVKRWKEQIGLPILEGLSHGCGVIASNDSGLYRNSKSYLGVTWYGSGDVSQLKKSLELFMTEDYDREVNMDDLCARLEIINFENETKSDEWFISLE